MLETLQRCKTVGDMELDSDEERATKRSHPPGEDVGDNKDEKRLEVRAYSLNFVFFFEISTASRLVSSTRSF